MLAEPPTPSDGSTSYAARGIGRAFAAAISALAFAAAASINCSRVNFGFGRDCFIPAPTTSPHRRRASG
jgi:hypothetical protein